MTMRIVNVNLGDWDTGTCGFSFELEGFYWRLLRMMYARGGSCANDDVRTACAMRCEIRVYRRLKGELIAEGKIAIRDGLIFNARVAAELAEFERRRTSLASAGSKGAAVRKRHARIAAKAPVVTPTPSNLPPTCPELPADLAPTSAELTAQVGAKFLENAAISTSPQWPSYHNHNHNQVAAVPSAAAHDTATAQPEALPRVEPAKPPADLGDRLRDAGGRALNPTVPGLMVHAEVIGWMQSGADLELDILPTIKALASRARPMSISSWRYFASAIAETRDRRLQGLPAVPAIAAASPPPVARTVNEVWRRRMQDRASGGTWIWDYPPDDWRTDVPDAILTEFGMTRPPKPVMGPSPETQAEINAMIRGVRP